MKKHNMMRVASALAVVTLLSTSVISGTLAKYTSSGSGSDTARVAKWTINAGTENKLEAISGTKSNSFTFDLFNTVMDTKTAKDDGHVKEVSGEVIVAPGTWGYVDLKIENQSEVAATYAIALSGNVTLPLEYAIVKNDGELTDNQQPAIVTGTNAVNWTTSITDIKVDANKDTLDDSTVAATYRVYWKWDYDTATKDGTNDVRDTDLGKVGTAEQTITATVTATQAD